MWNQLTREKRIILAELLRLKLPKTRIAERLGVDRSTIYRELKRNSGPMGYQPEEVQQRTDTRRWVNRTRRCARHRARRLRPGTSRTSMVARPNRWPDAA